MKNLKTKLLLIFLILIAFQGFAQTDSILLLQLEANKNHISIFDYSQSFQDSMITITKSGYYSFPPENHCIDEILFYYERYKKECYNDSILTEIETTINPNHTVDLGNGLTGTTLMGYFRTFENVYKHKQPTFTDFMNWINKQKTIKL